MKPKGLHVFRIHPLWIRLCRAELEDNDFADQIQSLSFLGITYPCLIMDNDFAQIRSSQYLNEKVVYMIFVVFFFFLLCDGLHDPETVKEIFKYALN